MPGLVWICLVLYIELDHCAIYWAVTETDIFRPILNKQDGYNMKFFRVGGVGVKLGHSDKHFAKKTNRGHAGKHFGVFSPRYS